MSGMGANYDLLRLLVVREVRVRYARAALGVSWAVFQPLVLLVIFTALGLENFVGERSKFAGTPYPALTWCGLIFWIQFAQGTLTGTSSIALARDILHKSRFPAELIPLSRVLAWLLDLAIGLVLLVPLLAYYDLPFHATALLIPVVFLAQLAFTIGVALFLSALNLFFRDVHYMVTALMPVIMFASNVVWPLDHLTGWKGTLFGLNPIVSYIEAYRTLLFLGELPSLAVLAPGLIGAVVALVFGLAYFRRVRPRFAEEV
ncbi:MAG: ABC transporter permease [Planctomycetota bacterium]|nr:ABC transporter permease [Planctomycetota bacterium]